MKFINKGTSCLNCGFESSTPFHYCPQCGQKNIPTRIHFTELIGEMFQNAFALDSRFGRSIYPFLFKPGFLTYQYISGRRLSYVNPFRLYLILSLVLFFVITLPQNNSSEDDSEETGMVDYSFKQDQEKVDSTSKKVDSDSSTSKTATLRADFDNSFIDRWAKVFHDISTNSIRTHTMTVEQLDSLLLANKFEIGWMNRMILKQGGKAAFDTATFENFVISKMPTTIFLMLPFFSIIVSLFYLRKKIFFIEHLVHAFHLHSFLFFGLLIQDLVELFGYHIQSFGIAILIICLLYFYKSMRNVYLQSSVKTILKMIALSFIYLIVFAVFFGVNAFFSLLIY